MIKAALFLILSLLIALYQPLSSTALAQVGNEGISCAVVNADWIELKDLRDSDTETAMPTPEPVPVIVASATIYKQEQIRAILQLTGAKLTVDYGDPEGWRLTDLSFVNPDWDWRGVLKFHRQGELYNAELPTVWITMSIDYPDYYFLFPYGIGDFAARADANGNHYGNHPCTALYLYRADLEALFVKR